ncbi:carboxylesterase 1E [Sergentomyia squamirostris]
MFKKNLILFVIVVLSSWNLGSCSKRVKRIVGGMLAERPPPDDPVIFVHHKIRTIRIEGLRQDSSGFYSFLGIPYAQPPIGKNRFVRAKLRKLFGDIMATKYPEPCLQPNPKKPEEVVGHEDCLKLNVHMPQMPDQETKLPVIVFLHGGGFRHGSPAQYDPLHIIGHKAIFVGVQYRLGSLGILGLGSKEFPSNGALSDCVAAVRWTHSYIESFGGDPARVTVLGHGSGAALAIMLTLTKIASPLIRGIIAMSGSALSPHSVDYTPDNSLSDVYQVNRCNRDNPLKIFRCLQDVPPQEIIRRDGDIQQMPRNSDLLADLCGFLGFSPTIEEHDDHRGLPGFLTKSPLDMLQSGNVSSRIRLLIGQTRDETSRITSFTKLTEQVQKDLESSASKFLAAFNLTSPKVFFSQISSALLDVANIPKTFLDKFIERTTDIIFSIPTVFTAKFWSENALSVMYSFNFVSRSELPGGEIFLPQLPLAQRQKQEGKVAHGDELIFLFEPRDIFGRLLTNQSVAFAPTDDKVRRDFTEMIVNFTQMNPDNETEEERGLFIPFSSKKLPFIEIAEGITSQENFRLCSLLNFGGIFSFVENISCDLLSSVDSVKDTVKDTVGSVGKGIVGALSPKKLVKNTPLKSLFGIF